MKLSDEEASAVYAALNGGDRNNPAFRSALENLAAHERFQQRLAGLGAQEQAQAAERERLEAELRKHGIDPDEVIKQGS